METELFRGRRVALVGPSRSIMGSGAGDEIESFDLVARINHQWPVPDTLAADLGQRMDILFHCCNGDYPVAVFATEAFADTRVAFYEDGREAPILRTICRELEIAAEDVTATYHALQQTIGTPPSTGLVAIARLLASPLAELTLFGITLGREPYYEGYPGHGARVEYWDGDGPAGPIWQHDMDREFRHFCQRMWPEPRLRLDPRSATVMKYYLQSSR